MLDNQDAASLKQLVGSGAGGSSATCSSRRPAGVSLDTVRAVAETGVDLISTSALTMGAPPVDVSMTLTLDQEV